MTSIPAMIGIRVRDGVWNTLLDFEIETAQNERPIDPDDPTAAPGAKRRFEIDNLEAVGALLHAAAPLARQALEGQDSEESRTLIREWIVDTLAWAIRPIPDTDATGRTTA